MKKTMLFSILLMLVGSNLISCARAKRAPIKSSAAAGAVSAKTGGDVEDLPHLSKADGEKTFSQHCPAPVVVALKAGEKAEKSFRDLGGKWEVEHVVLNLGALESDIKGYKAEISGEAFGPMKLGTDARAIFDGNAHVLCHNSYVKADAKSSENAQAEAKMEVPNELDLDRNIVNSMLSMRLQANNGATAGRAEVVVSGIKLEMPEKTPEGTQAVLAKTADGKLVMRLSFEMILAGHKTRLIGQITYRKI